MPNRTNFAYSLKALRQSKGLSQELLSSIAGLDRTYISMLERGKRKPSLETIEKIATALDMKSWELLKVLSQ
jgi:transcriptional regulator with XRE-family HTH domain